MYNFLCVRLLESNQILLLTCAHVQVRVPAPICKSWQSVSAGHTVRELCYVWGISLGWSSTTVFPWGYRVVTGTHKVHKDSEKACTWFVEEGRVGRPIEKIICHHLILNLFASSFPFAVLTGYATVSSLEPESVSCDVAPPTPLQKRA